MTQVTAHLHIANSTRTMTVPSFPSLRQDKSLAQLAKRCEDSHTMGMFRLQDSKFLIVYDGM